MKIRLAAAWLVGALSLAGANAAAAAGENRGGRNEAGVRFRDLSGVNQHGPMAPGDPLLRLYGWNRFDLFWSELEPRRGQWNEEAWDKYKKSIADQRATGVTVLPIFAYTTEWSQEKAPFGYEDGDRRHVFEARPEGKMVERIFARGKDGKETLLEEKDRDGMSARLAAAEVPAWEAYVRRAVRELRQEPYNIEYFQVWNEANPRSGFWEGNMDAYMKRVHLPAAKVIHEEGGKVVYGGWPCIAMPGDFVAFLDKYKAWDSVDVLAIHYFNPWDLQYMRRAALERKRDLPVWMTEAGFTRDYLFVPEKYSEILWDLLSDRNARPGLERVFYFAWWSPDDPAAFGYGACLNRGDRLTPHGRALEAMADLFDGEVITKRNDFAVADGPGVKNQKTTVYGFGAGDRLVVVVRMADKGVFETARPDDTFRLRLPNRTLPTIKAIERRGVYAGEMRIVTAQARQEGADVVIDIPAGEDEASLYTDELLPAPANRLRPIFYVVVDFVAPAR